MVQSGQAQIFILFNYSLGIIKRFTMLERIIPTSFRSASGDSSSAAKGGGIIDILRSLIDKKIMPSSEMNMPNGAYGGARGLRNPALPDSEKKRIVFLKKMPSRCVTNGKKYDIV